MAIGCYESLTNGEYDEQSMDALILAELPVAIKNGGLAAAIVIVVLSFSKVGLALLAGAAAGAVLLAIPLHLTVLVVGVAALRVHKHLTIQMLTL
jgi:Mg/Co/Ni transporter MgtE